MKKVSLILAIAVASLSFQACNNTKKTDSDSVENANDANDMKEDRGTGQSDDANDFAVKAANGGMMEVEASQLAKEKSQNSAVKEFADMMIKDHSKANDELKALAARKNITLPATLGEDKQEAINDLRKLSGAEFDKKYVSMMEDDHEKDVKLFKDAADDNPDADIKAFAAKTLPTLQMHKDRIKAIDDKMD